MNMFAEAIEGILGAPGQIMCALSGAVFSMNANYQWANRHAKDVAHERELLMIKKELEGNLLKATSNNTQCLYTIKDREHQRLELRINKLYDEQKQQDQTIAETKTKAKQALQTLQTFTEEFKKNKDELTRRSELLKIQIATLEQKLIPSEEEIHLASIQEDQTAVKNANKELKHQIEILTKALQTTQSSNSDAETQVPISNEHKQILLSIRDKVSRGETIEANQFIAGLPYVGVYGSGMFSEAGVLQLKNGAKLDCKLVDCVPYLPPAQDNKVEHTDHTPSYIFATAALTAIASIGALLLCLKKKYRTSTTTKARASKQHVSRVAMNSKRIKKTGHIEQYDLGDIRISGSPSDTEEDLDQYDLGDIQIFGTLSEAGAEEIEPIEKTLNNSSKQR